MIHSVFVLLFLKDFGEFIKSVKLWMKRLKHTLGNFSRKMALVD